MLIKTIIINVVIRIEVEIMEKHMELYMMVIPIEDCIMVILMEVSVSCMWNKYCRNMVYQLIITTFS